MRRRQLLPGQLRDARLDGGSPSAHRARQRLRAARRRRACSPTCPANDPFAKWIEQLSREGVTSGAAAASTARTPPSREGRWRPSSRRRSSSRSDRGPRLAVRVFAGQFAAKPVHSLRMLSAGRRSGVWLLLAGGLLSIAGRALAGSGLWTTAGPAPALISAIALDPSDPTRLYASVFDTSTGLVKGRSIAVRAADRPGIP